jgi:hypothetical protein
MGAPACNAPMAGTAQRDAAQVTDADAARDAEKT